MSDENLKSRLLLTLSIYNIMRSYFFLSHTRKSMYVYEGTDCVESQVPAVRFFLINDDVGPHKVNFGCLLRSSLATERRESVRAHVYTKYVHAPERRQNSNLSLRSDDLITILFEYKANYFSNNDFKSFIVVLLDRKAFFFLLFRTSTYLSAVRQNAQLSNKIPTSSYTRN